MKALIAAAVVVTSGPLLAAQTGSEANEVQEERKVCRRIAVARSQTRLGRQRVCLTAAQWRARSDMSVDDAMDAIGTISKGNRPIAEGGGG